MARRIDRWLATLAESVTRRRSTWWVGVGLVTAASILLASRLGVSLDAADFLPRSTPAQEDRRDVLLRATGHGDPHAVLFEADDSTAPDAVEARFQPLADALRRIDGVTRVEYKLTTATQSFLQNTLPRHALEFLEEADLREVARRLDRPYLHARIGRLGASSPDPLGLSTFMTATVGAHPRVQFRQGLFFLPAGRAYVMLVYTDPTHRALDKARPLVDALNGAIHRAGLNPPGLIGTLATIVDTHAVLTSDARRIGMVTTLVVLLLLGVLFRHALTPIVLCIPIAVGLCVAAAVATVVLGSINAVAWLFAAVVVGLGVDFGIHLFAQYQVSRAAGRHSKGAIAEAIVRPGPAIIFGGLTTAGALFSLQAIDYPVMTDVAWLTGIGVIAVGAASLTILPLVLASWSPPATAPLVGGWGERIAGALGRSTRATSFAWTALLIGGLAAAPFLRFEPDPTQVMGRAVPAARAQLELRRKLGASLIPLVIVSRGATRQQAFARDGAVVRRLAADPTTAGIAAIDSVARWLPDPDVQNRNLSFIQKHRDLFMGDRFEADFRAAVDATPDASRRLLDAYLPAVRRVLDPATEPLTIDALVDAGLGPQIDRRIVEGPNHVEVVSYVYLRRSNPVGPSSLARFSRAIEQLPHTIRSNVEVMMPVNQTVPLQHGLAFATLVTLLLVAGLLVVQFGRTWAVALCLTPLACGLAAVAVLAAMFSVPLDLMTLAIAPMIVGIGVDDGLHVVHRLRAGQPPEHVLREATASLGTTTATSVAALVSLSTASMNGLAGLGLLGSAGLIVSLAASLHLVPALYSMHGTTQD